MYNINFACSRRSDKTSTVVKVIINHLYMCLLHNGIIVICDSLIIGDSEIVVV